MKIKSRLFTASLFHAMALLNVVQAQHNTAEKRAKFYLEISQKYAPAAYEILRSDEKKEFVQYAHEAQTAKELMKNYGTVVHEACHGYNFFSGIKSGWGREGYFITTGLKIDAPKGSFFPSFTI